MTAMTIRELQACRDRGAAWLDDNLPGWEALIDLDRLDLDERHDCVLGQVMGDFWAVPLTLDNAVALGFQARNGEAFDDELEALDRLWRDLIEQRRAAGSP